MSGRHPASPGEPRRHARLPDMITPYHKEFTTADLSDTHGDMGVMEPGLRPYGGVERFCGPVRTVIAPEDNTLVRALLETPGDGHVLVVDGGGSRRCALLGDELAELAVTHGWVGVVVYGCIRDSAAMASMKLGVRALDTHPRRSVKRNQGVVDETVTFLGVTVRPRHWLYADRDGVVVADRDVR